MDLLRSSFGGKCGGNDDLADLSLGDQDKIVASFLKRAEEESDDESVVVPDNQSTPPSTDGDSQSRSRSSLGHEMPHEAHSNDKWVERNCFQFGNMEIYKVHGRTVEVRASAGPESFTGDMKSKEDVSSFQQTVLKSKSLEKERGDRQVSAYRKAHSDDKDKDNTGLLE